MIKENRLVFEFEQPKEGGLRSASQGADKIEQPEGLLTKAFDKLKGLEKSAEKEVKINAIFDQLKPLQFVDFQKIAKQKQEQNDAFNKAFEEESIKALIAEKVGAGYEFVEFNNDGLAWTWRDPVGNLTTRINPIFQLQDVQPVLNDATTDRLAKLHEELINNDLEAILENLVKGGFVADKTLPIEYLKTTDFARDIREALVVVHSLPAGHGYILGITKEGEVNFLLEDESLKEKGYKDLSYSLKNYDQYLNQPKPIETTEQKKSPSEEPAVTTFEEINRDLKEMDSLAEKYPDLQEFSTDFKRFLGAMEKAILVEKGKGITQIDVGRGLVANNPDLVKELSQLQLRKTALEKKPEDVYIIDDEYRVKRVFFILEDNTLEKMFKNYGISYDPTL